MFCRHGSSSGGQTRAGPHASEFRSFRALSGNERDAAGECADEILRTEVGSAAEDAMSQTRVGLAMTVATAVVALAALSLTTACNVTGDSTPPDVSTVVVYFAK